MPSPRFPGPGACVAPPPGCAPPLPAPDADRGTKPSCTALNPGPPAAALLRRPVHPRYRPQITGCPMMVERSTRRMTLRQLLTHSEKCTRDLIEHFQGTLLPRVNDFRDLNRPIRRKSHY